SLLADLQNGYGVLLAGGNRLVEAVQAFRKALTAYPESEEGHANLCNALIELGRDEEARHALQTAIRLHPWNAGNHLNLGYLHARAGRLDEAVRCYRRALRCKPDYVEAHNNLGIVYDRQRRFEEAIECFRNAIRFNPNYEGAHYNLGLMYLRQGDWEQGWPEYEWRLRFKDRAARSLSHPQWDGSPLKGKTILLRTEQGLGDTIQFVRYAVEVKNRGGHVIVECPATLIPLLSTCRGIDQFIATGAERPDFDVHAMMMSLPAILKTSLSTVPCDVPYLAAEPERMRIWEQELAKDGNGFRVGIAWRGSPTFKRDRQRSIPLSAFEPIARLEGVQLYSLQKGCVEAELAAVCDDFRVVDLGTCLDNQCGAFLDTAAVMMHLDLIVSIDSAPAHLAGALGVPVWVALPYAADWRWLADCDESPWYPSMRLFRQSEPGKWGDVFERMAAELAWRRSRADERAVQGTCETSGSD
ncbi:MAG: tetratricopeptide repeat protein, partial [Pirellulaceae bacterium]